MKDGHGGRLLPLALGALGVVYGDIGTSPLYSIKETFGGHGHELEPTPENVLGVLSLAFWALILIISIKYIAFVMRADRDGEGGVLALTSLMAPRSSQARRWRYVMVLVGLFGTALLYGDGAITPAISVLAAVEGTTLVSPGIERFVVPIAVVILVGLFAFQSKGTERVGKVFGPIMVTWFVVIAVLGLVHLVQEPSVLKAINPVYGIQYFTHNGFKAFLSLGAIFLVVTGGEALYADMGHFGRRPIALGWFAVALPALLLNYAGQAALLLQHPDAVEQPFFRLAPEWGVIPLVVLATAATVIASQALIAGLFSLTMQAVQLDYAPRVDIDHTSPKAFGQIYIPAVNWTLLAACIALVVAFGSSAALAAAYGVAVTATMVITTLLFSVVAVERLGWPRPWVTAGAAAFVVMEVAFLAANLFKIPEGGWFPLVVGVVIFTVLTTWNTGRKLVRARIQRGEIDLDAYLEELFAPPAEAPARVDGMAIYLFGDSGKAPPAMVRSTRHYDAVHEDVLVVTVAIDEERSHIAAKDRAVVTDVGHGVTAVTLRYGFMEEPDVPKGLSQGDAAGLVAQPDEATYFIGWEDVTPTELEGMALWREHLFALVQRNATPASDWFRLPSAKTVIVGVPVEI